MMQNGINAELDSFTYRQSKLSRHHLQACFVSRIFASLTLNDHVYSQF
jgi:ribosomal protein L20